MAIKVSANLKVHQSHVSYTKRYKPFLINELICLCDQYRLCEKVQFSYPLCAFFTLKSCHALVNTLCLYINKTAYNMVYTKYPIMVYTKNLSSWLGYFVYTQLAAAISSIVL